MACCSVKKFTIMLLTCLTAGFFTSAQAGPPEGVIRKMTMLPMICLQADVNPNHFATLVGELTLDYGVNISMTFSTDAEKSNRIAIIENPEVGMVGVLMNTDHETCIAFSGQDRKVFIRRPDHPIGILNEDKGT